MSKKNIGKILDKCLQKGVVSEADKIDIYNEAVKHAKNKGLTVSILAVVALVVPVGVLWFFLNNVVTELFNTPQITLFQTIILFVFINVFLKLRSIHLPLGIRMARV